MAGDGGVLGDAALPGTPKASTTSAYFVRSRARLTPLPIAVSRMLARVAANFGVRKPTRAKGFGVEIITEAPVSRVTCNSVASITANSTANLAKCRHAAALPLGC
jgi:hypothetical protein